MPQCCFPLIQYFHVVCFSFVAAQDSILDIASHSTRLSLSQQLQDLGNVMSACQAKDIGPTPVTFDLLAFSGAEAVVTIEHDQLLDAWMGSMAIHLTNRSTSTLTESNLQNLPGGFVMGEIPPTGHGLRAFCRRSQRSASSRSSRSSRSSSRSSPGSPSTPSRSHHSAKGTISELHCLREACMTKLKL